MSSIPAGSRVSILNGVADDGGVDSQPIADSFLGGNSDDGGSMGHRQALDITGDDTGYQTLTGTVTLTYDPATQTLSLTLNASGLTPGARAAHIHLGSCSSQGSVQYMLMDLTANSQGQVAGETRVITGVTSVIPASGMYLNIHQGDSNAILANGQPTIAFRPLLCANIWRDPGRNHVGCAAHLGVGGTAYELIGTLRGRAGAPSGQRDGPTARLRSV
jgi:CHRD domain